MSQQSHSHPVREQQNICSGEKKTTSFQINKTTWGEGGGVSVYLTQTLLETTVLIMICVYSLPLFLPCRGYKNSIFFTTNHNRSCSECSRAVVRHTCENTYSSHTCSSPVRQQRIVGAEEDNRLWPNFPDHCNKSLLFCSGRTLCVCFHHDRDGACVKCVSIMPLFYFFFHTYARVRVCVLGY